MRQSSLKTIFITLNTIFFKLIYCIYLFLNVFFVLILNFNITFFVAIFDIIFQVNN